MKRTDAARTLRAVLFFWLFELAVFTKYRQLTVYAFAPGRPRKEWHFDTEVEALRHAASLAEKVRTRGLEALQAA